MSFRSSSLLVLGLSLAGVVIACAPEDGESDRDGNGTGGATNSTGGATSSTGGAEASGGTATSGGASATGGAATSGGSVGTGGDVGTGGGSTGSCTPNPSGALVDQGAGVVHDERTCLDWQKQTTISSEGTGIEGMAKCPAESTGGFSDWRAPTASELASIVTGCNGGNWTETPVWNALFDDPGDGFWTATPDAAGSEHQCLILSNTGAFGSRRADVTIFVRCVRGQGTVPTVKDCNDGTPNCSNWAQ